MRFSEIARVLLVRPIVPMLVYAKAAASDAVAFRIVERLRRWIVSQSGFAQIIVGIRDIREIGPFRSQKIEARLNRCATPSSDIKMLLGQASLNGAIFHFRRGGPSALSLP